MNTPEAGDPGAAWDRFMRQGDWEAAWRISDAVLAARGGTRDWSLPRHLQAVWTGAAPHGRHVLVRCYHGLGDTIQFARYLPALGALARQVTVWAQPALIPLLATMDAPLHLLPLHDGTPEVAYDVDIEVMELAHLFRSTPATLPGRLPYLHPPRRARDGKPRLAVGMVWQAGDWDPRRSIPFDLIRLLGAVPGVALHILQRGPALAQLPPGFGVPDGSDDVLQAAHAMTGLDLVVSVDTMPAHLAGALGVPVWTLLAHTADWRWMEGRADSPWYPTMRLYRQPRAGDWAAVIARVAHDLAAMAAFR